MPMLPAFDMVLFGGTGDLVMRKLLPDGGRAAAALRAALAADADACAALPQGAPFARALRGQLDAWAAADAALLAPADGDAEWPLRAADDYLAGVGHALLAWAWARIARTAGLADAGSGGRDAASWLAAARFGIDWLLPQAQVHWARVNAHQAALPFVAWSR